MENDRDDAAFCGDENSGRDTACADTCGFAKQKDKVCGNVPRGVLFAEHSQYGAYRADIFEYIQRIRRNERTFAKAGAHHAADRLFCNKIIGNARDSNGGYMADVRDKYAVLHCGAGECTAGRV